MIRAVRHMMHFVGMRLLHTGVLQCRIGTWLAKHSGLLCLPNELQDLSPPPKQRPIRFVLVQRAPSPELLPVDVRHTQDEINHIREAMHERLREMGIIIHDLSQVQLTLQNLNDTRRALGDQLSWELERRSASAG